MNYLQRYMKFDIIGANLTNDRGCSNASIRAKHGITGISFIFIAISGTMFKSRKSQEDGKGRKIVSVCDIHFILMI